MYKSLAIIALVAVAGAQLPSSGLMLSLACPKTVLKIGGRITLRATLTNNGQHDVSLYRRITWNQGAGFAIRVVDSEGHRVIPRDLDDDLIIPSDIKDPSSYVTLAPGTFYGVVRSDSVDNLLRSPGKYTIYLEYRSPIPGKFAITPNFFGTGRGTLTSGGVRVTVEPRGSGRGEGATAASPRRPGM